MKVEVYDKTKKPEEKLTLKLVPYFDGVEVVSIGPDNRQEWRLMRFTNKGYTPVCGLPPGFGIPVDREGRIKCVGVSYGDGF